MTTEPTVKRWQDRIDLASATMTDRREAMFQEITELRAQVARYGSRLESIATIAHDGGLAGMTEDDALVAIRRLTLPMQNRSASFADTRAAIDKARKA